MRRPVGLAAIVVSLLACEPREEPYLFVSYPLTCDATYEPNITPDKERFYKQMEEEGWEFVANEPLCIEYPSSPGLGGMFNPPIMTLEPKSLDEVTWLYEKPGFDVIVERQAYTRDGELMPTLVSVWRRRSIPIARELKKA